jgi:hypothetical protein
MTQGGSTGHESGTPIDAHSDLQSYHSGVSDVDDDFFSQRKNSDESVQSLKSDKYLMHQILYQDDSTEYAARRRRAEMTKTAN